MALKTYPLRQSTELALNLETIIKESGMTKRQVAKLKGVTPETVSRHAHNKIQLTLQDAEQYAAIFGVSAEDILFSAEPVKIVVKSTMNEKHSIKRSFSEEGYGYAHGPDRFPFDVCCGVYSTESNKIDKWYDWVNSITYFKDKPIKEGFVDRDGIQNAALVCTKIAQTTPCGASNNYFIGQLFPQPHNLYTMYMPYEKIELRDLELVWATPMVSTVWRPDLSRIKINHNAQYEHA